MHEVEPSPDLVNLMRISENVSYIPTELTHYLLQRNGKCELPTKLRISHYILAHLSPSCANGGASNDILAGWPIAIVLLQPFHHIPKQFRRKASPTILQVI
jgi:hypothetical protein